MDPLILQLVRDFVIEAREVAQATTTALLALEQESNLAEGHRRASRSLHTLKGSAATLGLLDLSELIHAAETALAPCAKAVRAPHRELVDALLTALDAFVTGVEQASEGMPDRSALLGPAMAALLSATESTSAAEEAPHATEGHAAAAPADAASGADLESADPLAGVFRVGADQVLSLSRDLEQVRDLHLRLREHEAALAREIARLSSVENTGEIRARLEMLRIGLRADAHHAAGAVASLEAGVQAVCTLPARRILTPLHRSVRDLALQFGKEASLDVVGGDVALDRRVLEGIKAALQQLVRNAVAHGIELPEERERRGKHRVGAIVVRVEQAGSLVQIEIGDDGSGLDERRIREVAIERGMVDRARAESVRPEEIVFMPGFSTSGQVSEGAGRGVGLDIVQSQVRALGGTIELSSVRGQGMRAVISLPVDIGASAILVVRVGELELGVPLAAVESAFAADTSLSGRDGNTIEHRDEVLLLRDLGALLRVRRAGRPARGQPILVVQAGGSKVALFVDAVVGENELVTRPMPEDVGVPGAFLGVATLGLGQLLVVLSPAWLLHERDRADDVSAGRRALVVDDSITARAMYRAMLESAGFAVHAAASAEQAVVHLSRSSYEIVVSDVVLHDRDGLWLTRTMRGKPETRATPVILVSMHDADEDRERAFAAGADAFVPKKDCASGRLLGEVSALMSRRRGAA